MSIDAGQKHRLNRPSGLRAMGYASYRITRNGEVVVATSNEDFAIHGVVKATTGDTIIIAAPGAGKCLKIKTVMINNASAADLTLKLEEGSTGTAKFQAYVPQAGGTWNINLLGSYWLLPPNTGLYVNQSGAGDVYVNFGYEVVEAIAGLALSDSETISESGVPVRTAG